MGNFCREHAAPLMVLAFLVFLILLTIPAHRVRTEFMDECMQDHKKYECDAMWRAGR